MTKHYDYAGVVNLISEIVEIAISHAQNGSQGACGFLRHFVPDVLRYPWKMTRLANLIADGHEVEIYLGCGITLCSRALGDKPHVAILAPGGSSFAMDANRHIQMYEKQGYNLSNTLVSSQLGSTVLA